MDPNVLVICITIVIVAFIMGAVLHGITQQDKKER